MGAEQSSVLTVPSLCFSDDVAILRSVFGSHLCESEGQSGTLPNVLVDDKRGLTLIMMESTCPTSVVWVCDQNDIELACTTQHAMEERVEDQLAAKVLLHGGNFILMVTSDCIRGVGSRAALANLLRQSAENGSPSMPGDGEEPLQRCREAPPSEIFEAKGEAKSTLTPGSQCKAQLPRFPTLDTRVLGMNGYSKELAVNSIEPIPFETEIFKGQVLLLLRPVNLDDDPYWSERIFSKKKRRIVLHIQGKFKKKPTGKIMFGAEISQKMKVGLLTKGILGLLIRLLENFFADLRYSFGDNDGNEWPRIVAPTHSSLDSLVATPPDKAPPPFSEDPFPETKEAKQKRKKTKEYPWNEHDTYSMSYYSMYVDFPTWKLLGLPVAGDLDLRTVWNDSFLRIVIYEKNGKQRPHLQRLNKYACGIQLRYAGVNGLEDEANLKGRDLDDLEQVGNRGHMLGDKYATENNFSGSFTPEHSESQNSDDIIANVEDMDDLAFFDAEEASLIQISNCVVPLMPASPTAEDLLSSIDAIVPAWIDVAMGRSNYGRTYAVVISGRITLQPTQVCESLIRQSGVQREVSRKVEEAFSPRLSASEKMRRTLALCLIRGNLDTLRFFSDKSRFDDVFLAGLGHPDSGKNTEVLHSTRVARAVSDRHWIEECVTLTKTHIAFYHFEHRKRSHVRVKLSSILSSGPLDPTFVPFSGDQCFWSIETSGRSIYLMFKSSKSMDEFARALGLARRNEYQIERSSELSAESDTPLLLDIDDPTDEFLHKSTMWNCKHRRILNCGRFSFRAQSSPNSLKIAESALMLALDSSLEDNSSRRRLFLSTAAELKETSPYLLSENERLAFYLNIYHTMVMHAFLVLGPPGSSLKWISYFNNIAYEVGDDIFSLTELEHCIIRANMSYPSQLVSRFILPKSTYQHALALSDYRINFALNCGSTSNPKTVFVYYPDQLDEQLNQASRLYLEQSTVSNRHARDLVIHLPRVCQWFSEDFGDQKSLLSKIVLFLKPSEREKLSAGLNTNTSDFSGVSVKYDNYSFQCRPLSLNSGYS